MSERLPGIRPRPTLWRRLDAASRAAFPAGCTALLLLLLAGPLGLPGQVQLLDGTALGCVFFWSLVRPASLPPVLVFLLGVLADLLRIAPLGSFSLILLLAQGLALSWRHVLLRQGFLMGWLAFLAVAAGAAALDWALASLLRVRLLPPGAALLGFTVSAGLYPALAALFNRAQRSAAAPEAA